MLPVVIVLVGMLAVGPLALREALMTRSADRVLAALGHGATLLSTHLAWVAGYGLVAAVVAAMLLALAVARRPGGGAAPQHFVGWSLLAGALWPVVSVGVAQLGVVALVRRFVVKAADTPSLPSSHGLGMATAR